MKRFLFYLEILWIAAIVASVVVFAWNFYQQGSFNVSGVYSAYYRRIKWNCIVEHTQATKVL